MSDCALRARSGGDRFSDNNKENIMSDSCCAQNDKIMILPCSGGSNVGQLSNQAAVELTQEGFGKMYCLAGIGGRLDGFIQSARDVPAMMAIDGCPLGCARATLEKSGVPLKGYLVITDLGIEKNKDFNLNPDHLLTVKEAVKEACCNGLARKPIADKIK